jgi:hypothetical protein
VVNNQPAGFNDVISSVDNKSDVSWCVFKDVDFSGFLFRLKPGKRGRDLIRIPTTRSPRSDYVFLTVDVGAARSFDEGTTGRPDACGCIATMTRSPTASGH